MGVIQVNGTRGELTPYLHSRIDIDHYQAGFARALNWISLRFGGLTRMPGTIYMGKQRAGTLAAGYWMPFLFNNAQTYALELTSGNIRFWNAAGQVMLAGVPYTVVTPYTVANLPFLKYRQIGDVIYITCPGRQPRTLTRNGETDWVLEEFITIDGPYLKANETSTTLTPDARGSYTNDMTANNVPASTLISSSGGEAGAYKAFNTIYTDIFDSTDLTGWVSAEATTARPVDAYWLRAGSVDADDPARMPNSWTFDGYDGTDWIVLDTRSGEAGWSLGETRYYEFQNRVAYEAYRLSWTSLNGATDHFSISTIAMHVRAEDQSTIEVVASSTTGINEDDGFKAGDVGRSLRLRGSDGKWRWARITAVTNTTTVRVQLYGHALPDLAPMQAWRMSLFGDTPGYPEVVGIHEDRLVFASYPEDPAGVVASVSADYDNFAVSTPVVDDDAVTVRLTGGKLNAINWMADGEDMLFGTDGSIRAIGRNENARAFAPGNVRQRTETEITTSYIDPIKVENMLLALDGYRSRIYEIGYDDTVQGYVARDLSALNEHLVGKGVTSWAYQANPHKLLWMTTDEGTLLAAVYDRQEKVFGVTECTLGPGSFVERVLTLPGTTVDGDQVWFIVRRPVNGITDRYVEKLSSFWREGYSEQEHPIYAHCAGVYEGVATNAVGGITHLLNETVGVWADGVDLGDVVIDGAGVLTLPLDITAVKIIWGIRATSRLETLRLATMPQVGSMIGQRVNVVKITLDYYQSADISAGTSASVMPVRIEADQEHEPLTPRTLRTGTFDIMADDSWDNGGVCVIESNSMHPATIRSITAFPEGEP